MPKKKVEERPDFLESLELVAKEKGLTLEDVLSALKEAIAKAYIRSLGGGDDAVIICEINPENGEVTLGQVKKVCLEDDITDDYLEISVEEANEGLKKPKYKPGDDFFIPCPTEEIGLLTAQAIKNNLRQKLAEAERAALYDIYKDHIGELVIGTVERYEDRSVTINLGRATIEMSRKDLIGDEFFHQGDPIKVYIQEVRQPNNGEGSKKGPQIEATRSSEGFLRCLFEEEIHEIYDGTVVIKAIARLAGVRSKVAVYSRNEDVDATGACIGPGGNRIQKIVSQLGGGSRGKEKIDVLNWFDNVGAFVIEACRPVIAIGANIDMEEKKAKVIINDGEYAIALGRYCANRNLASKITGFDIEFVELSKALERGITFTTADEWKEIAEAEREAAEKEAYLAKVRAEEAKRVEEEARRQEEARRAEEEAAAKAEEARKAEEAAAKAAEKEAYVAPSAPAPRASARPEEFPAEAMNPAAAAMAALKKAEQEAAAAAKAEEAKAEQEAAAAPAEEPAPAPIEETPSEVKTTTTLEDLEKELEAAKEKKTRSTAKKRPRKITEEEVKRDATPAAARTTPVPAMPVYTEEELAEMEAEENEAYDDVSEEDIDEEYSDYADYYDDDGDR